VANKKKVVSAEVQHLLKTVYDCCMKEDVAVRERQLRSWRRLKLLWEGFQRIWFNEVAHDWRIWDETADEDTDQAYYDKQVNVFKAYLESIIAALSVVVPPVKCFPDDAENPLDIATARAGDQIGKLVYRHNEASLLWLHALFIHVTEGMVACYSYPKADESYGTYEEKTYDDVEGERENVLCSNCGHLLDSRDLPPIIPNKPPANLAINPNAPPEPELPPQAAGMGGMPPVQSDAMAMGMKQPTPPQNTLPGMKNLKEQEIDEFMPDDEDAELHAALYAGKDLCPACMQMMDPEVTREKFITTRLVNTKTLPKSRICLEVYGGLYVKIPNYAKRQKDVPYLIYSHDDDYAMTVERFEHLHGNPELLKQIKSGNQAGAYTQYDQWARLSPQYQAEYPMNVVTTSEAWIRPGKFNVLQPEEAAKLKELFPDGVKVTFVNDQYAEACNEALDDCWTLTENPMSEFLHFEPLGQGLCSIQEITNDLISLVLQTIEHGIGQTFADPGVLNFKAYSQTETTPGGIFPAMPKSGKSLNDGFHEMKTATLSAEVLPFSQQIQSLAQLQTGALPSLFGGQMEGTETASQYSMSRAQALQRLQNTWKMFTSWWKIMFSKVIPMYIDEVKEMSTDQREVEKNKDGNFVNVFIRKAELEGRIGRVELEANENLPLTWAQTKDLVEKLMTNPNPAIAGILSAPENIPLIHEALGLVNFFVPNEDDVVKQYDEIRQLLDSEPIPTMNPEMPEMPSVEIDPDFDNHAIEFEIVRKWIISEAGRQTKIDNEPGYRNVLLHGKMHLQVIQQQQQQQMMQQAMMASSGKGATPGQKPKETQQEAPIMGEGNVATVQ
jgi:hypothetical protein